MFRFDGVRTSSDPIIVERSFGRSCPGTRRMQSRQANPSPAHHCTRPQPTRRRPVGGVFPAADRPLWPPSRCREGLPPTIREHARAAWRRLLGERNARQAYRCLFQRGVFLPVRCFVQSKHRDAPRAVRLCPQVFAIHSVATRNWRRTPLLDCVPNRQLASGRRHCPRRREPASGDAPD